MKLRSNRIGSPANIIWRVLTLEVSRTLRHSRSVKCLQLSISCSLYFQNAFFNDPSFGVKRNTGWLEFASHGCDYCFWMIHYRSINPFHDKSHFVLLQILSGIVRGAQRSLRLSPSPPRRSLTSPTPSTPTSCACEGSSSGLT